MPPLESSFVMRKVGPLPVWAWMGLGLGAALAFSAWRGNKRRTAEEDAQQLDYDVQLPDTVQPTYVFQNYDQEQTHITMPPAGTPHPGPVGPPGPPGPPGPIGKPPVATVPKPVPKPGPPPAPRGEYVTVARYTTNNPPWNSTLWGIAQQKYNAGKLWPTIWGAPQNATIRARRVAPNKIQPGDRIWVPSR